MTTQINPRITVVGACNIDLISYVPRMPSIGETLHGKSFHMGYGGKGANQAVMAAKLGATVSMVSKVGSDVFGDGTIKNFDSFGIDVSHVHQTEQAFSGVAPICVDSQGRNSIVIVTGANDLLTIEEINAARDVIASSEVLVCQMEIPLEISLQALRIARDAGVKTIFNPAPACHDLPDLLYTLSDIFCPNESETAMLTNMPVDTIDNCILAAKHLQRKGAGTVLLTLGERGALIVTAETVKHIPAHAVKAVDSTGAGDCFVGSLAYGLSVKMPLEDAVGMASAIATRSVLKEGTQTSFPMRDDVLDIFSDYRL